jgi:hypothetical protein
MGPGSPRQRHYDGGSASRNPSSSREREGAGQAYGISPTAVQKWRKRQTVADEPMGHKQPIDMARLDEIKRTKPQ